MNNGLAIGDLVRIEASLMKSDPLLGVIVSISDARDYSTSTNKRHIPRGTFQLILYDILMNHDGQVWTCSSNHFKVWKVKDEPKKEVGGKPPAF